MGTIGHLTPNPLSMDKSHARVRTFARAEPFVGGLGIYRWGGIAREPRARRPPRSERPASVPRPSSNTYRLAFLRFAQCAFSRFDMAFFAAALHGFRFGFRVVVG